MTTRAKSAAPTTSRLDAAAQGKRKREALGEVARPAANVTKGTQKDAGASTDLKGKAKAKEVFVGVVLKKPPSTIKTSATTSRQPLRSVSAAKPPSTGASTRRTRSVTAQQQVQHQHKAPLDEVKEEEEDEEERPKPHRDVNAMAIDVPAAAVAPVPAPRRLNVARSSIAVSTTRAKIQKRVYQAAKIVEEDDDEASRAFKKRRTSSDAPEDDLVAEQEVERVVHVDGVHEADPDGDDWDDLDAEDADDPLMVSEYVVEIFDYLKRVEVRDRV